MGAKALTLTRIDLDEALASRQINLLYQPVFSLKDGGLARIEALCRWDHPRFGTMLPAVFLPAFETEGQLTALTRYIIERAAAEFGSWAFAKPSGLSINLAAHDCTDPTLPASVKTVLDATRIEPGKLTFECPVRLEDAAEAKPVLTELKKLGVRLAAEMMGRGDEIAQAFSIAPFDEIKTGGRGLLRAARNNHTASLQNAAELIAFAEEKNAIVSAIGAEDEPACLALRTVGFHQVQANVLSSALQIDAITPRVTNAARELLGLDAQSASDDVPQPSVEISEEDRFRTERLRVQAEAFKRAAERKADTVDDHVPPIRGARAVQNVLAESYGETAQPTGEFGDADARDQQEALMQAESNAGLLMRPTLASDSLGYGASPLRRLAEKSLEQTVAPASEEEAKRLSKEPEVAKAITDVLGDLPTSVEERGTDEPEVEKNEAETKADELDATIATLPTVDPSELNATVSYSPVGDELHELAARLRPTAKKPTNFLTRKYKLRVTHFWPKPWKRAFMQVVTARQGLSSQEVIDRLPGEWSEQHAVPVMTQSQDEPPVLDTARDDGAISADEGAQTLEASETLSSAKAR